MEPLLCFPRPPVPELTKALNASAYPWTAVAGVDADVVINPKKSLLAAEFSDVLREVQRAFTVIEQKLLGNTGTRTGVSAPHKG